MQILHQPLCDYAALLRGVAALVAAGAKAMRPAPLLGVRAAGLSTKMLAKRHKGVCIRHAPMLAAAADEHDAAPASHRCDHEKHHDNMKKSLI